MHNENNKNNKEPSTNHIPYIEPYIEIKDLCFHYTDDDNNPIEVLKGLDLTIEKGSFTAILGRNGSGKSTLARLLSLILEPSSGEITVNGIKCSPEMTDEDIIKVRRSLGMVFQNPDNQLVATVVEEDVAFGPENLGIEPDEIRRRVESSLAAVGMTEYSRHAPSKLSGGQKQRIAIAGVIAMMPDCIIFDESTAMLDPLGRSDVMKIMQKLNHENGMTIITITHNMDEAILADRVIVLDDGRITLDGTPNEIFTKVDELHAMGLAVPQASELIHKLRLAGAKLPSGIISDTEAADAIAALLDTKGLI